MPVSERRPCRHIGIAVEDIGDAEPFLFALGCRKLIEESVEGRFRWAQYDFGREASRLELIAPEARTSACVDLDNHGPGLQRHARRDASTQRKRYWSATETASREYREYQDWTEAFVPPSNLDLACLNCRMTPASAWDER
ncbi:VOC family protein [Halogeometricum sp. wsp3]|nr:VOC family protein [Halogeometricum sp. wsp3]